MNFPEVLLVAQRHPSRKTELKDIQVLGSAPGAKKNSTKTFDFGEIYDLEA